MKQWYRLLVPVATVLVLTMGCELTLVVTRTSKFILPRPSLVIQALIEDGPWILDHLGTTMMEAVCGFGLGVALGVILALLYCLFPSLESVVVPLAVGLKNVPFVAIAPILFVLLGYGPMAKIMIVAVVTFFPVMSNLAAGLRSVNMNLRERLFVLRATKWQMFVKLQLPASVPFFVTGLEVAVSSVVIAAIVGELLGTTRGLGFVILMSVSQYRFPLLMAAVVVTTVVSIGIALGLRVLTKGLLRRWLIN